MKVSTADRPTVVRAINQWGAKIESTAQYNTIFEVRRCEHVVVDGLEVFNLENRPFQDWNDGITIWESNHVVVQNCYAHDCGCGGFGGRESDYMTFRRNVARDNAKTNPYNCSGISIYQPIQKDDAPGPHIIIEDNVCFENECRLPFEPGGFDRPTDGNGIILDDFNWTQNNDRDIPAYVAQSLIQNNLSFNNGGAGAKTYEVENAIFRNNTTAHNNYVIEKYGTHMGDLAAEFVTGQMEFYNNIAIQAFGQRGEAFNYEDLRGSNLIYKNNIAVGEVRFKGPTVADNNLSVNHDNQSFVQFRQIVPDSFEFASVDDFRQFFALRPGSPALDFGEADLAPGFDLTGDQRPADGNVDAGAFEGATSGVGPVSPDRVLQTTISPPLIDIALDGNLDPAYPALTPIDRLLIGQRPQPSDFSAGYTAAYDREYLYMYVAINDNSLRPDQETPEQGDGIEIFIDADNSRGDAIDGINDFHFISASRRNAPVLERNQNATEGVTAVIGFSGTGYGKEFRIPWSTLGATPAEGLRIGFDVNVNDRDGDASEVTNRYSWQAREDSSTNEAKFLRGTSANE